MPPPPLPLPPQATASAATLRLHHSDDDDGGIDGVAGDEGAGDSDDDFVAVNLPRCYPWPRVHSVAGTAGTGAVARSAVGAAAVASGAAAAAAVGTWQCASAQCSDGARCSLRRAPTRGRA